jgi:hypothetical protein
LKQLATGITFSNNWPMDNQDLVYILLLEFSAHGFKVMLCGDGFPIGFL